VANPQISLVATREAQHVVGHIFFSPVSIQLVAGCD
jgi:predicted N-acetyltransferase YhbS